MASWTGWGGPRVVNNVVVTRTTNINVTNITVYKNVHVHNAVVAVPGDRFGHGHVKPTRIDHARVRELKPVRGALDVKPVATSVMPAGGSAVKPPAVIRERKVIATRAPRDFSPTLQAQGLGASREVTSPAAAQLVPAPKRERGRVTAATAPENVPNSAEKARRGHTPTAHRAAPPVTGAVPEVAPGAAHPGRGAEDKTRGGEDRARRPDEKTSRAAAPPQSRPGKDAEPSPRQVQQPPAPPAHDPTTSWQASKPGPRAKGAGDPRGRGEREQGEPPMRDTEQPDRPDHRGIR